MDIISVKLLLKSGRSIGATVEAPHRICQISDAAEQYAELAEYINAEYDLGDDEVKEVLDASLI